jgi:hypothetical protein
MLKNSQAPPTASTISGRRPPAQLSANKQTEASTAQVTNSSSDIVYKRGARSISRRNEP